MRIEGLTMSEPNARYAAATQDQYRYTEADCNASVHVSKAYLIHHGPDRNYRPALKLVGELRALSPSDETLPYGIETVTFPPGTGQRVEGVYEFDDSQLIELVTKGYFHDSFTVPSIMQDNDYELPLKADFIVLPPQSQQDVPVVFTELHGPCALQLDEERSEYRFSEFFEPVLIAQPDGSLVPPHQAQSGPVYRDGELDDVLADMRLDEVEQVHNLEDQPGPAQGAQAEEEDDFTRALAETRAELDADIEEYQRQAREVDPTEAIYRERVASDASDWLQDAQPETEPVAEETPEAVDQEPAPEQDDDVLDLNLDEEEDELGVAPIALSVEEEISHQRSAREREDDEAGTRRQVRLRNEGAEGREDRDAERGLE